MTHCKMAPIMNNTRRVSLPLIGRWSSTVKVSIILYVLINFAITIQLVASLRNPMRTVRRCDINSAIVPIPFSSSANCERHCEETYIRISMSTWTANRDLSLSYLQQAEPPSQAPTRCCCVFNTPWPSFLKAEWIGRKPGEWHQIKGRVDCLPRVMSIRLTHLTKQHYNTMCQYLSRREPLTMIEALNFAKSASYLNYMKPKHPVILRTLHRKDVKRVDKVAVAEIDAAMSHDLLDSFISLEEFGGYQLATDKLKSLVQTKKSMEKALKSRMIAEAFDEYVISYVILDVIAAVAHIEKVNKEQLSIPIGLLQGNYDKYDGRNKHLYFTMKDINCKQLNATKIRLSVYLNAVESLLATLYEKLIFEHMKEKFPYLIELIHSQKIYDNLMEVNCGPNNQNNKQT